MTEEEDRRYWELHIQCNKCAHNWYCEIPKEQRVKPCKGYHMSQDLREFLQHRKYGSHGGLSHERFT